MLALHRSAFEPSAPIVPARYGEAKRISLPATMGVVLMHAAALGTAIFLRPAFTDHKETRLSVVDVKLSPPPQPPAALSDRLPPPARAGHGCAGADAGFVRVCGVGAAQKAYVVRRAHTSAPPQKCNACRKKQAFCVTFAGQIPTLYIKEKYYE